VDDMDQRARPKRTRVLRVADIIPPFDEIPAPADASGEESGSPEFPQAVEQAGSPGDEGREVVGQEAGELPKYDLAENILAEQRRVASRRRKAPSQVLEASTVRGELRAVEPSVLELPSQDLPELQRIVAEIVARDIERLCRRPNPN